MNATFSPRSFSFSDLEGDDIPPAELEAASKRLGREMLERIRGDILATMTGNTAAATNTPAPFIRPPELEIYRPEPPRPFAWLYGAGVVNPPSSLLKITASDSDGIEAPEIRAEDAVRVRARAKAAAAVRNCRRCCARGDEQRARYWLRVAERWMTRGRMLEAPRNEGRRRVSMPAGVPLKLWRTA